MTDDDNLRFFRARHASFCRIVDVLRDDDALLPKLLDNAFDSFEQALQARMDAGAPVACNRGCATCCTVRVTATAPEILLIARHLWESEPDVCARIVRRVAEADMHTRFEDAQSRVALRQPCPFIDDDGACAIYPVRPLACRGHASHDRHACELAACGKIDDIPHSVAHRMVRSLVQNALQSALRDAGYTWASYELNHAVIQALSEPDAELAWRAGEDVFADAQVDDVSPAEMAQTFDWLKGIRVVPGLRPEPGYDIGR